MTSKALIFGGAHLDKEYTLYSDFIPTTSNPCSAEIMPGGVGLNLASHLKSLGLEEVSIVSAVGLDNSSDHVLDACKKLGVDSRFIYRESQKLTAEYICGLSPDKDVLFGLANMDIYDSLNFGAIKENLEQFREYPNWLLETNFSQETIHDILSAKTDQETFVVATSSAKVGKLKGAFKHIDHLFLNEHEFGTLLDRDVKNHTVCLEGFQDLHEKGVKNIYMTRGERGALVSSAESGVNEYKQAANGVKRRSGAGDAFASAAIYNYISSKDLDFSAKKAAIYARDLVEGKIDLYKDLTLGKDVS